MENFDLMSKNYDTEKRVARAAAISEVIGAHIENGKSKTAMEYGCGTGLVGIELAPLFDSLLFVDSSQGMIEQVDKKIKDLRISNASALCQDIVESTKCLPQFDYIFMSLVLHHIRDTEMILSSLKTLLNESGHLLIVDLNKDDGSFHAKYPDFEGHNGYEQKELLAICKRVGFRKRISKTFYHGSKEFENKTLNYSLFILDGQK